MREHKDPTIVAVLAIVGLVMIFLLVYWTAAQLSQ